MHGGAKDFCENVRYNAIKRFLNEKLEQIERENNPLRKSMDYRGVNLLKKSADCKNTQFRLQL
jgi:hypothetical protein